VAAAISQPATPGILASFQLGSFTDAGVNDSPWALDVNWGDGSAHTAFNTQVQGRLPRKPTRMRSPAATPCPSP